MTVINKVSSIETLGLTHSQNHAMTHTVTYDTICMMHDSLLTIFIIITCTLLTHS